jgi:hypothetical protein
MVLTKTDSLRQFLTELPPQAAVKLMDAVESGALPAKHLGLPIEEIRVALAPALAKMTGKRDGALTDLRLFTAPFEDFLFDGERTEKEAGLIPRSSVEPIWTWITKELVPDTLPAMLVRVEKHIASGDKEALKAAVTVLLQAAGSAMAAAIERCDAETKFANSTAAKLGGYDVLADAREIADVFAILDEMQEMQLSVPRHIRAFDERMVSDVRDLYDDLYEKDPDRAIYLALAVMGRLECPWHILRLARKVALKNDDTMISRTDFSILGERLIRRLELIACLFENLRPGLSDLEELHQLIVEFSELSKGITREIELLRIGNWGQRLLKARNVLSTAISDEFAHYPKDLGAALPMQRVGGFGRSGPRRVEISHMPDEAKLARIRRELKFVHTTKSLAQSIGAQAAFDKLLPELEAYMVTYEDAIIEEMRHCEPDLADNAEAFLEFAAEVSEKLTGQAGAATLLKRGRVALQASA